MTYAATEIGLTRATKALLAMGVPKPPEPIRFDDKPYVKQDNRPVKRYVKKGYGKRKMTAKRAAEIEGFQQQRIFSIVRDYGSAQTP